MCATAPSKEPRPRKEHAELPWHSPSGWEAEEKAQSQRMVKIARAMPAEHLPGAQEH